MDTTEFINNCESCGAQCCRNWNLQRFDPSIVDENGVCIYLNQETNLCTIYNNRPVFCRVYEYYWQVKSNEMSLEEYLRKSKVGCKVLQNMSKRSLKNAKN
jgi:Fe-S-cluster containining protein